MIKIIKMGIETYDTTCDFCDCHFTYQDEDITVHSQTRTDLISGRFFQTTTKSIICPCCKRELILEATK